VKEVPPGGTGRFKVLRFLDTDRSLTDELKDRWKAALARGPAEGGPSRVAVAWPLESPAEFAAIDMLWFDAREAALSHDEWIASVDADLVLEAGTGSGRSCQVVAEEVVLRGPEYLENRWRQGGSRLKMMSFGKRNPALTLAEFSREWRNHSGRLGDEEIPAGIRGLAYVQNHPIPHDGGEWPFDAVNEVYFERAEDLERRREYFAARQDAPTRSAADSFISPTERWSMFVEEWPVEAGPR
jgi:hypothetical protein